MGLLPLEFTDCLQDSPLFRDSLHSHEKELERTSNNIKELIKETKNLLQAAKALSSAQRRLSQSLINFKFECIGNNQTDDENWIAGSLKEFGKLISAIEDEKDKLLDRSYEQFIVPLETFRKEQIGAVKDRKKKFDKQTAKFCASQERYLGLSTKKQDTVLQEADAMLEMEQRDFVRAGLEYVALIQEVQEKKKFEFVEILLGFMYSWLTFYHSGHEVANDFRPHMTDLQTKIQRTRENFNSSRDDIQALMRKMLEVRQSKPIDPGTLNKLYTRTGYLFLMEKKALGTTWSKCYCYYQRDSRLFRMIPYNQTAGKVVSSDSFKLKSCVRRFTESIDKRFCFDLVPEDRSLVYTFQALSEEDRELWLDAMDGNEPMFVHPPKPSNANQTFLDEAGFNFVTKCFQTLENRGFEDQGLYRVVGVQSKVNKLLTMGLDRRKCEKLNLDDQFEFESKTVTSAVKTFYRNLPEPIMTFKLHASFIEAAKLETYIERVAEVQRLVDQLPEPNKRMLELLMGHLEKVSDNCKRNMMTVSNLAVCFGPTLLRAEEETVAAIMDIKFANVIVEILIENWRQILRGEPFSNARRNSSTNSQSRLVVLPVNTSPFNNSKSSLQPSPSPRTTLITSPKRPPPPYPHPPPPPSSSTSQTSLTQQSIYNQGAKVFMSNNRSPSSHHNPLQHSLSNASLNQQSSYSQTWERTLRGSSSNLVPVPTGSAPPPSTSALSPYNQQQPRSQHASMLNLDQTNQVSPSGFADSNLASNAHWHHRLDRQPPIIKTRAPLQRQLSAGQTSLISSNSGGPSTPRSTAEFFQEDSVSNSNSQGVTNANFHGNGIDVHNNQDTSSGSSESLTSTSSRDASSFETDNHVSATRPNERELDIGQAVREASITAAQAVAASNATIKSLASASSQPWSPAHPSHPNHLEIPDGRSAFTEDSYNLRQPPVRGRFDPAAQAENRGLIMKLQNEQVSASSSSSSTASTSAVPPIKPRSSYIYKAPTAELKRVRTLYACVGEHETELSFEPNQIITSIRPSIEPGWLEGCLDGKFGLVPENYVEFIA